MFWIKWIENRLLQTIAKQPTSQPNEIGFFLFLNPLTSSRRCKLAFRKFEYFKSFNSDKKIKRKEEKLRWDVKKEERKRAEIVFEAFDWRQKAFLSCKRSEMWMYREDVAWRLPFSLVFFLASGCRSSSTSYGKKQPQSGTIMLHIQAWAEKSYLRSPKAVGVMLLEKWN